jgi:hypothetical protein
MVGFDILNNMRFEKKFQLLAVVFTALAAAQTVQAHLPCLERGNMEITASEPEISKAYYGWLDGNPAVYSISARKPFLLHIHLLAPKEDNSRQDYSARIYKDGELFGELNGYDYIWLVSYDPFANDYYNKGPEYETQAPAGNYKIEVYNSGNSGNYVLAVGKKEDLSLGQFLRTLAVLPGVKEEFFGKSKWGAFNNYIGLVALAMVSVLGIIVYFIISFIRLRRLKQRLDNEYKNNR